MVCIDTGVAGVNRVGCFVKRNSDGYAGGHDSVNRDLCTICFEFNEWRLDLVTEQSSVKKIVGR
jgi:hypothetical protein